MRRVIDNRLAGDDNRGMAQMAFLGGTFDPVHNGHLVMALAVAEQLGLPKVTLVPSAQPPHKDRAVATADQRLAMLRAAVEGEAGLDISEVELHRPPPSYTIDTIATLRREHPGAEIAWIVGADMLVDLPRWRRATELVTATRFIVVARPPMPQRLESILDDIRKGFGPVAEKFRVSIAAAPLLDISSSDIRRRAAAGLSIRYLVPDAVEAYIRRHGLYR